MSVPLIAFSNITRVMSNIQRKFSKMSDRKTVNARAVAYIDSWIQRNFKESGVPAMGGSGWQPLAASTIKYRRHGKNKARAGQASILQDRGWLKSHWKHLFTPWKVAVQSSEDYGIYHDSDKPRKRLPQRRIIPRAAQVAKQLRQIFTDHMKEALKS